jgi:hypothetical protein
MRCLDSNTATLFYTRLYSFIHCVNVYKKYHPESSQDDIFYTSIQNIQVYARIKHYQAETNVYTTFIHPYKLRLNIQKRLYEFREAPNK